MNKRYIYNVKTHTLHIEGFCPVTFEGMALGDTYRCFSSENEAIAYDGRSVGLCKRCQKKRDLLIRKQKGENQL